MKKYLALFLFLFLYNSLTVSAQGWLWGRIVNAVNGTTGYTSDAATDKAGDTYQVGTFYNLVIFGADSLNNYNYSSFLVKYDHNGNVLWASQSSSPIQSAITICNAVALDDSGNAYITGETYIQSIFGTDTLNGNMFVVKYNQNGKVVWATQAGGGVQYPIGYAITTDKFGHVFVTGSELNGGELFLTKYDRNGNVIWTRKPVLDSIIDLNNQSNSIVTDVFGNCYTSGRFNDTLSFGNYHLNANGKTAIFVAKYDSNGNVLWAEQSHNTPQNLTNFNYTKLVFYKPQFPMATDGAGALYLTGTITDSLTFGSHTFTTPANFGDNFFVLKLDAGGNVVWGEAPSSPVPGANEGAGTNSICTDDSGHVYIAGAYTYNSQDVFAFAGDTLSIITNDESPAFIMKLDTSGKAICSASIISAGNVPALVTCNGSGKYVYMSGASIQRVIVMNDTLQKTPLGGGDYILRWQSCDECNIGVVSATGNFNICNGQSIKLTANGATNFTWKPGTGLNTTVDSTVIANPSATTTYSVSTTSNVCADSLQVVVQVRALPIITITPQSSSACSGRPVMLIANGAASYTWSPVLGLNTTTGDSVIANLTSTTTYTIIGTKSGCVDTTHSIITVNPAPVIKLIPQSPAICFGNSDTIKANGALNYTWSPDSSLSAAIGALVIANPTTNVTYTVTGTDSNGCTASDTVSVTVKPAPDKPIITESITTDSLISSAKNGNQWYYDGIIIPDSTRQVIVIKGLGHDECGYSVTVTDSVTGCSATGGCVGGINRLSVNSEQLSVYPNPSTGLVTITSTKNIRAITATNLVGQKIVAQPAPLSTGEGLFAKGTNPSYGGGVRQIDLSALPDGLYFITVNTDTGTVTKKVVVTK